VTILNRPADPLWTLDPRKRQRLAVSAVQPDTAAYATPPAANTEGNRSDRRERRAAAQPEPPTAAEGGSAVPPAQPARISAWSARRRSPPRRDL